MSYWPMSLVRKIDRSYYGWSVRTYGLEADVCQQLYLTGWSEVQPIKDKCRIVSRAIVAVLHAHGLRRVRGSRLWRLPNVDDVVLAARQNPTVPRRAWHAANDRRKTWSPEEEAIMLAARHKVGYQRVANMLGRTRDQIIAWYRRRERRKRGAAVDQAGRSA